MSQCELTGKKPVVKNLVSHSNIKTKTIAQPNIQSKRIYSKILNQMVRFKLATSAIRDMEHQGGFDVFIINQSSSKLSKRAVDIKARILKKLRSRKN